MAGKLGRKSVGKSFQSIKKNILRKGMKLGYEAECILRFNKLTGYRAGDLIKPK
jgi:hypothetical protein